ncbi:hypothetical protein VTO42DRAFT_4490 [Malbranchea cinnamomea]
MKDRDESKANWQKQEMTRTGAHVRSSRNRDNPPDGSSPSALFDDVGGEFTAPHIHAERTLAPHWQCSLREARGSRHPSSRSSADDVAGQGQPDADKKSLKIAHDDEPNRSTAEDRPSDAETNRSGSESALRLQ